MSTELRDVSNARSVKHVGVGGDGFVDTDIAGLQVAAELIEE
jgi:hypothetical protein